MALLKSCNRISFVLLLSSCLTPIDIPTERIGNRLVVSGQVSTIPDQNIIQLSVTAEVARLPFPLSGATVTLFDDGRGTFAYEEDFNNLGTYILNGISGAPGRTYQIQIILPTDEVYESKPEKMADSAGEISTYFGVAKEDYVDSEGTVSKQPFIKIYANSRLAQDTYTKWTVDEAFILSPTDFPDPFGFTPPPCFIEQNADPQRITLFNGTEVKALSIDELLVSSRIIDFSFWERHYFTTYQSALTKEAFEYWRKVNVLANQKGSIFDTPPAEINGNLFNVSKPSEKVYGYFQAVNQIYDRFYVFESDLPFRLLWANCTFDNRDFMLYPARCFDCLSVRNSTYNRPAWF